MGVKPHMPGANMAVPACMHFSHATPAPNVTGYDLMTALMPVDHRGKRAGGPIWIRIWARDRSIKSKA